MIYCVHWTTEILNVIKIFLDFIEFMIPLYIINWIIKILQILYFSFNILENMLMVDIINWTNKILQNLEIFCEFIELMPIVYIFSNWEIHLLDCFHTLHDFIIFVLPVNLVDRIIQRFQISQVFLNLTK